ncbi:CD151 antigen isoform X4 [Balaenoptera musculus]|uniref:CD151 antigen isoform X4 n=1 Tax=Balaenoptera musculus TaxID=9771 RepID=A0A8B8YFL1_BALMU|nr:CD151 antigen isoform X4 [Balaenoptera musculus]
MWHHLPQVPALHLQLLLLAGWSGRHGRGHLDTGPQERLHQPAGLGHLPGHSLHPGGGGRCRHGDWGSGLLRHLQGAEGPAASVLHPAPHHLSAGDHCGSPGLCLLPADFVAEAVTPSPQLNAELKENLKDTMTKRYHQLGHEGVTSAVDKLQQEFHCCGSNNSQDWRDSEWIRSGEAGGRVVPDSCCKTVVAGCGQRDHASNIYKVEGGCITKLETFIQEHLRIIGAVGLGIACVQVFGMIFTCCLYKSLKLEHY